MALSKTDLLNLSLGHLGTRTTVENIETEVSVEAVQGNLWYDTAREQALAEFDWGFARTRLALASHGDAVPGEWLYRYQHPGDCVAPRRIINPAGSEEDDPPYKIFRSADGTRSIVTDVDDAVLIYTRNETDITLFTPHFIVAFTYLMASFLAPALTRKTEKKANMTSMYLGSILVAGAQEGNQETDRTPRDAEHIRYRTG